MVDRQADELTRRTGLDAEARVERARKAGEASNSVSSYVKRVVRGAPELTPDDIEALRRLVAPIADAEAYATGVKVGAEMALQRIVRLASEAA